MSKPIAINDVRAWLRSDATRSRNPADLLIQLAERLVLAGLPLHAMTCEVRTLHPLVAGAVYSWRRGQDAALETPRFHNPFGLASENEPIANQTLSPGAGEEDGHVSAFRVTFSDGSRHVLSVAADGQAFTEVERRCLEDVASALAAPLELLALKEMTRTLMTTYLGKRTADRVLSGAIKRGDSESVHAVLWYSDLRGFTALSESQPGDRVIALLNSHFERLAAPIKAFGGEVLKFMGDGLLAIFPVDSAGSETRACNQAIKSVRAARAGMASLNAERRGLGDDALEFGVALHIGEVLYGNIGAPDRLDFTVIGPTVNLASRLETLCKPLDCPVLASADFEEASDAALTSLGRHRLPDIRNEIEVFTLNEFETVPSKIDRQPL